MHGEHTASAGVQPDTAGGARTEPTPAGATAESPVRSAGVVHQINRSSGGVPKLPVPSAQVTPDGLEGDWQANRKYHGGPDRALCLFALETIEALRAEGHPILPGTTGENITVRGLEWAALAPGVVLRIGAEVEIQITSYTAPCKNIAGSFVDGRFVRISEKLHPGDSRLYARVLRGGRVDVGDPIQVRGRLEAADEPADS